MNAALPDNLKPEGRYGMTEAAKMLGIDRATLYRWAKSGKIRISGYFQVNGRAYIKGKEINRTFNRSY